jgi:hypothetical protein
MVSELERLLRRLLPELIGKALEEQIGKALEEHDARRAAIHAALIDDDVDDVAALAVEHAAKLRSARSKRGAR